MTAALVKPGAVRMPADRAQAALLRALTPLAGPFVAVAARSVPWSSATFEGARHRLALRLAGTDAAARADRLRAGLDMAEIAMRGAFVADIVVTATMAEAPGAGIVIGIEALTIDESDCGQAAIGRVSRDARRCG